MIDEKKIMKEFEKIAFTSNTQKDEYKEFLERLIKDILLSEGKALLSELNQGDEFETALGKMIVLEQFEDKTLVVLKDNIGEQMKFDSKSTNFNTSEIKDFLLKKVLPMFEMAFGKENIVEETTILEPKADEKIYGSYIGKLRLLTYDEVTKYNKLLKDKELSGNYWTISSLRSSGNSDIFVGVGMAKGHFSVGTTLYNTENYVRPVCCLRSDIFVQK